MPGPYKVNGVPLRRVNQAYVIATSTKVDVSKVNVSSVDDEFFARVESASAGAGEDEFFAPKPTKVCVCVCGVCVCVCVCVVCVCVCVWV